MLLLVINISREALDESAWVFSILTSATNPLAGAATRWKYWRGRFPGRASAARLKNPQEVQKEQSRQKRLRSRYAIYRPSVIHNFRA